MKLNADTFDNVMTMLNSPDKESIVLGLTCIEELDTTTGLVYLLLMRKLANVVDDLWQSHAPKKVAFLKGMGANSGSVLTYKKILDLLAERKVPATDIEFYLTKFAEYLTITIKQLGYTDIINSVDITLNLKLHDTKSSGESSKNLQESDA